MRLLRTLCVTLLLAAVTSPTWAMLPQEKRVGAVEAAVADAEKAMADPQGRDKARFYLLAVAACAFGDGAWENNVPEALRAKVDALIGELWPDEKITRANAAEALKSLDPIILKYVAPTSKDEIEAAQGPIIVFPNVSDRDPASETISLTALADLLLTADKSYPDAIKRSVEFAGQSPSPMWLDYYAWHGAKSGDARRIVNTLLDVYLGPAFVAKHAKDELLPWSLKNAQEALGMWGQSDEPEMLTYQAGQIQRVLDLAFWADKESAKAKELDAKCKALLTKAKKIHDAEVKANRVPTQRYQGADAAELRKAFGELFAKDNPTRKVLGVSLYDQAWVERAIVTSGINSVQAGIYRLLGAAVVVKQGTKCWVHPVTFARQWTGTGNNFGPPKIHSWYDAYEILPQNAKP